jgi:TldD protein
MNEVEGNRYFAERQGVTDELLQRALTAALERGGDDADLFLQHKLVQMISYEDGKVSSAALRVDLGAGVRTIAGDQTGYAYTEELADEGASLIAAARTASTIAAGPVRDRAAEGPRAVALPSGLYPRQRVWSEVAPEASIELVQRVGAAVAARDRSIVKVNVRLAFADETILVARADGALVEDTRPMTYLFASCVAEREGRRESNAFSRSARAGFEVYTDALIEKLSREVVERTLLLFDAGPPAAGEMPVVLAPATSGILLHEAVGHGF